MYHLFLNLKQNDNLPEIIPFDGVPPGISEKKDNSSLDWFNNEQTCCKVFLGGSGVTKNGYQPLFRMCFPFSSKELEEGEGWWPTLEVGDEISNLYFVFETVDLLICLFNL